MSAILRKFVMALESRFAKRSTYIILYIIVIVLLKTANRGEQNIDSVHWDNIESKFQLVLS